MQLREKQKAKFIYGVLEKQFRGYFKRAKSMEGQTGENLMTILETRLDNVVFRLGFARTRKEARQMVTHGHICVNGRRVDIPSFRVRPGELVSVAPKAKELLVVKSALVSNERVQVPAWLEIDIEKLQGSVLSLPTRDQIDLDINEQLIVEDVYKRQPVPLHGRRRRFGPGSVPRRRQNRKGRTVGEGSRARVSVSRQTMKKPLRRAACLCGKWLGY